MASGAQTLTPKQLVILQWMSARCTSDSPEGWARIETMERRIKFSALHALDGRIPERMPIQEDLLGSNDGIFPLTGIREARGEPYLLVHKNGTTYRITQSGKSIARRCGLKKFKTSKGEEILVVDHRTGRAPLIATAEMPATIEDDDEDDAEDQSPPAPQEAEEPGPLADEPMVSDDHPDLGTRSDEINGEPPQRGAAPTMTARVPAPQPVPAAPTKQPKSPRPAHRKATVPGRGA